MTSNDRFWAKVQKSRTCWTWTGAKDSRGYGAMRFPLKMKGAHRIAWEIERGAIPAGLMVLHRCDRPACVRPDHLFLGTQKENVADMVAKGRAKIVRGEAHGSARLTADEVAEIRRLYGPARGRGKTKRPMIFQADLAKRFGVSVSQISLIVRNRLWVIRS